jgi:cation diffusion facilitator CzcD-associated flavoprotein CzcO
VAVIGAGSSGIQIVPSLQPGVQKLDHYVRGKTWIATPMAAKEVEKRTSGTGSNFSFSEEEIRTWKADPALYLQYRRALETELQSGHGITMRGSELQRLVKEEFTTLMKSRLATKPEIAQHLLPEFSPLCKGLTPGPGYLEALTQPNVEVIATPISKVTQTGIVTEDGQLREVDAIVCATGFDTSFKGRSPVIGQDGVHLNEKWADRPDTYLSVSTNKFPNFFMSLGPNSALGAGSLLIILEYFAKYIGQCVEKIQQANILTMQPSKPSVDGFTNFCEQYF